MPAETQRLPDLARLSCELHGLDATEGALAKLFLERGRHGRVHNGLVREVLTRGDVESAYAVIEAASSANVSDLVSAFEVLVPADEAKHHGAVFTPEPITRFLASESVSMLETTDIRALDPAVGCGALLAAVLVHLAAAGPQRPSSIVEQRLFGVDISVESLGRAKLLLALACIALGDDPVELRFNLHRADSLTADWAHSQRGDGFDLIIGNPPYVRYQNLPLEVRADLASRYETLRSGNWNLYFAFFELAHQLVRPGGVVAFITPNQFMTSLSGGPLREFLAAGRLRAVVDFGTHRVFEALTYTAITFGRGASPGTEMPPETGSGPEPSPIPAQASSTDLTYIDVAGLPGLAELAEAGPGQWLAAGSIAPLRSLGRRPWRLVGPQHAEAIERLATVGTPLGELADVRYGVATCRDRLYLLSGARRSDGTLVTEHSGVAWPIEDAITRKVVRVPLVGDSAALRASATRIIYPYELSRDGARALEEEELSERYPMAFAYLCSVRSELAARDKGRKTYAQWFAYGRTQGLVPLGDKLLSPLYAATPRLLRDRRTDDLFVNGCAVAPREGADLDVIQAVLRSGLCRYFVEQTGVAIDGGFYAYQKPQLSPLSIIALAGAQRDELLAASPGRADDMLAELYGLSLPAHYRRT